MATTKHLRDSRDEHAIEKEWLFWMINGFADPVVLTDETRTT